MILNIGHRGFGVHAIENTLSAFEEAIQSGLHMVELDVQLTKDHEVVVFHDKTLRRLGLVALKVENLLLEDLKQFHIFQRGKNHKSGSHEIIPSLREVIELTNEKIVLNIELKNCKEQNLILVKKVVELIKEYDLSSKVILSSFNKNILEMVSQENDEIRCGYIFSKKSQRKNIFLENCSLYSIHPYKLLVGKKLISRATEQSVKVFPWTVNSAKLMRKLINLKVDGIITNYPLKLTNVLLERQLTSNKE